MRHKVYIWLFFNRSGALQESSLCIKEGQAAWLLVANVTCLNDDGNLFDACFLAVSAALSSVSLPDVSFPEEKDDGSQQTEPLGFIPPNAESHPLQLQHIPVSASFSLLLEQGYILADTSAEEENLALTRCSIVVNDRGEICSIIKPGGKPFPEHNSSDESLLKRLVSLATNRSKSLFASLQVQSP